ncbi:putative ATP-dependent RNA helicase DDX43 [Nymphon striatum]|nr:putative ATP-dependent RNA helicase DDX43 [Nymphon striatum]
MNNHRATMTTETLVSKVNVYNFVNFSRLLNIIMHGHTVARQAGRETDRKLFNACHSVSQTIEMIDETKKRERAIEFIDNMEEDHKVIIFVGKKAIADDMTSDLVLQGIACDSIHGDREQEDREQALEDFKSGHVKILIATDVASRGLDISDITHIFNYDFPRNVEEYVHRIGRTGRAGRSGESITLVTREDWRQAEELIKIMVEAEQEVPEELHEMAQRYAAHKEKQDLRGGPRRGGGRGRGRGNSRGSRW